MWIFSGFVQSAVVTILNLRTLRGRLAASTVAVVGMAGVVGVLVSVLVVVVVPVSVSFGSHETISGCLS